MEAKRLMFAYSPAQWVAMRETLARTTAGISAPPVGTDDRCVNEGAYRSDGTVCRAKAGENGWCAQCWAEIAP